MPSGQRAQQEAGGDAEMPVMRSGFAGTASVTGAVGLLVAPPDAMRWGATIGGIANLNWQIIYPGRKSYGEQMPASPVVS
jgi:hypothetical protein